MRLRNRTLAIISILLVRLVTPAQQPVAALDRNDPELRAILSEIESDIEKTRIKEKIAGLSVAIVYDQNILLSKGFGLRTLIRRFRRIQRRSIGLARWSQAKALKDAEPSLQKYTGRYVLSDPNAVRTVTFSEFAVSMVNQKLVVAVPELRPGSVVYMKKTPLESFGDNVFRVVGGSFYGNFMTFESNEDGSMVLKWRNYVFKRRLRRSR